MFRKVLIANRGEVAVRIVRALREANIASVAVFSDVDRAALHVRMADEAERIGPAPSSESYLAIDRILEAAKKHGADAIHPGYGFLSENAEFAAACKGAGITFIGPTADAIRRLGSKTAARILAKQVNVPVVPGSEEPATNLAHARQLARELGYPVLLKAAAGGGGKGMRRVDTERELESGIREASSEAERAFHNSEVYIEKVIENPRHIEIQIAGDGYGNLVHLGERECSLQRRHQKIFEECPSPFVARHPELRDRMGEAALRIARAAKYSNLGTLEFLVDREANFYFLEVNTRLQVEHPVTELATGQDLVQLQLRIAAGESLPFRQKDVAWRGWATECRVCAEDPDNQFFPSPGRIVQLREPSGPNIRVDSGVYPGWTVPLEYDSLLAKLIAWGPTRNAAIQRLLRALHEYSIAGVQTNLLFFRELFEDSDFREANFHTGFIADFLSRRAREPDLSPKLERAVALAAAARAKTRPAKISHEEHALSNWLAEGRDHLLR
jgi:acetyl-CoA carboxylase, biotin carboxylase subunit